MVFGEPSYRGKSADHISRKRGAGTVLYKRLAHIGTLQKNRYSGLQRGMEAHCASVQRCLLDSWARWLGRLPKTEAAAGFGPLEIVRITKASPEPVTILAIGPVTNIALAILAAPDFKNHVKEILLMGGAVKVPGNVNPAASFNFNSDPHAVKIVYDSGIPLVQLGLDVCDKVKQRQVDIEEIAEAKTPVSEFLRKIFYSRTGAVKVVRDDKGDVIAEIPAAVQANRGDVGIGLNDLTTTGYLMDLSWFKTEPLYVEIETEGITPGRTCADLYGVWGKKPNCTVALDVDGPALVQRWVSDMKSYRP